MQNEATSIVRARHLLGIGRAQEAVDLLLSDSTTQESPLGLVMLSTAYGHLDLHDLAVSAAASAISLEPEWAEPNMEHAFALLFSNRLAQALPSARRAVELEPSSSRSHFCLSNVYNSIGDTGAATRHANIAIELDPDAERGWDALCRAQLNQRDVASAEITARKILEINPNSSTALLLLGTVQAAAGSKDDAIETLVDSLRADPSQQNVQELLSVLATPSGLQTSPLAKPMIILAIVCGLSGVIAILWAIVVLTQWRQIPKDVRQLVYADRAARNRIGLMLVAAVVMIGISIAAGVVVATDLYDTRA